LAAAIRLGLKLRFGGRIDHLDLLVHEEPDRAAGVTRRYLLLYDTVPGGTGYLHELLRDAGRLFEVFRLARDRMAACDCRQDPALDGCYRCLFAYRLGAGIATPSRDTAIALLGDILDAQDRLEPVATLSDILINPSFDSVLEARLIEALKRRGGSIPACASSRRWCAASRAITCGWASMNTRWNRKCCWDRARAWRSPRNPIF